MNYFIISGTVSVVNKNVATLIAVKQFNFNNESRTLQPKILVYMNGEDLESGEDYILECELSGTLEDIPKEGWYDPTKPEGVVKVPIYDGTPYWGFRLLKKHRLQEPLESDIIIGFISGSPLNIYHNPSYGDNYVSFDLPLRGYQRKDIGGIKTTTWVRVQGSTPLSAFLENDKPVICKVSISKERPPSYTSQYGELVYSYNLSLSQIYFP